MVNCAQYIHKFNLGMTKFGNKGHFSANGTLFAEDIRAYNKMTLYSSGLFFVLTASGCIDNALALPVSPSLQDEKTLAFGTTIHFVRDS